MPIAVSILSLSLLLSTCAAAQQDPGTATPTVPRLVRVASSFHPVSGPSSPVESVTLSIYRDERGGTALWSETQNINVDAEGRYAVLMGSTLPNGVPADLFSTGEPRWIGVTFNRPGEVEQPRTQLVSVPYALKAVDAETLGGRPASAYMLAPAGTGGTDGSAAVSSASTGATPKPEVKGVKAATSGTVGCIGVFTDPSNLGCANMYEAVNTNIGIGTSNPKDTLEINGNLRITSLAGWGLWDATPTLSTEAFFSGVDKDFRIKTTGGNVPGLTIKATSGNVGIGTSSPLSRLQVAGDVMLSGNLLSSSIGVGGSTSTLLDYDAFFNMTVGPRAGGISGTANTAVGFGAMGNTTTGSPINNTGIGTSALAFNTGSNNTAVGMTSLSHNTTGSNNIAIGFGAANSVTAGNSNNIHIGTGGASTDSNTIRIGGSAATSDTVIQTSFFAAGIRGVTTGTNDAVAVLIDSKGQLGTVSSSRRYKEDIHDMGDASLGLMHLRPVTFRYKKPFEDGSKPIQYGLIAEEVAEIYPDLVAHGADGRIETVKYQLLPTMLLNEVQRQERTIAEQSRQISDQQTQIEQAKHVAAQQAREIEQLRSKIGELSALEARLAALESATAGNR